MKYALTIDGFLYEVYVVHIICANMEVEMALFGYSRVSTDGQSLTAQVAELKAANCQRIFKEKVSAAKSDRSQLNRLLAELDKGDVLVVTRLDRLARSTRDLLNLLGAVAEKGAGFKSLRDTWADTTTAHGRLMLTVLGGLAEFERELIRTRTGEGRQRAMARGVVMGRRPKLTVHQRREAIARREAGEVLTDIARTYNVSHSTISRLR
jgi:DNA invertase Pin-like site-specific DNA recombinase